MNGTLLDTHVLLWLLIDNPKLGRTARRTLDGSDRVHVSSASTWELVIKAMVGKVVIPDDLGDRLGAAGLIRLPVTAEHTLAVRDLAGFTHHDPFDRLLVAQARTERLTFITADAAILSHGYAEVRSARE